MNVTGNYKQMCTAANELQMTWQPKVGDNFLLLANYCDETNESCTSSAPCFECIDLCNLFILGSQFNTQVFLFNPHLCNRDGGFSLNETAANVFVLAKKDSENSGLVSRLSFLPTYKEETLWIPSIGDFHALLLEGHGTDGHKLFSSLLPMVESFVEHQDNLSPELITTSEEAWVHFYMETLHNKTWNGEQWQISYSE